MERPPNSEAQRAVQEANITSPGSAPNALSATAVDLRPLTDIGPYSVATLGTSTDRADTVGRAAR